MNGYWHGVYTGSNQGKIVVEIDELDDHFRGSIYAYDDNQALPVMFANVRTANKAPQVKVKAALLPVAPATLNRRPGLRFLIYIKERSRCLRKRKLA
jgi:hypothetical protein